MPNLDRRSVLAGLAAASGALAAPGNAKIRRQVAKLDAELRNHIDTVVIVYAENRSFNNLFNGFPGLQAPLMPESASLYPQRDRDGSVLSALPPIWGGLAPVKQVVEHQEIQLLEADLVGLANAPFPLCLPDGTPLPHGVVTRDLVHTFYNNRLQINGGLNDGFVAWGDSGALVMGHYADGASNLRIWQIAREFTLCDNFFMGAFGGSFLNHQYLISARPPYYPAAHKSPANLKIVRLDPAYPGELRPLLDPRTKPSAMDGPVRFMPDTLTPDFFAVNTMLPPYLPGYEPDPQKPGFALASSPSTLPPQSHATIGDRLTEKGVSWAWYAGSWEAASNPTAEAKGYPPRPNFQPHHQPFNYFQRFAPGQADRQIFLKDAGLGESVATNKFLADVEEGNLPSVVFYKPQGNLNMHAGYSDVDAGDRHIAQVFDALRKSPQWGRMLVVITFDENGGWWDHVAPPKGDRWGPGTRIPAIVASPFARAGHVDHTIYDTGSIARFLNRRFDLSPLDGLVERERAMVAAGGAPPGDLTNALIF